LSELRERIQAVEGGPGQAPADPRILLALWLYATLRGVGSARELNRLCQQHVAYRWLCGKVSMNYHTLSDFRTAHVDLLDRLLTESAASLMAEGLVTLDRVAQDGMKVRASAGAASFRRQPTLEEALATAEEQLRKLKQELDADPAASKTRQHSSQTGSPPALARRPAPAGASTTGRVPFDLGPGSQFNVERNSVEHGGEFPQAVESMALRESYHGQETGDLWRFVCASGTAAGWW
jgi:transposase